MIDGSQPGKVRDWIVELLKSNQLCANQASLIKPRSMLLALKINHPLGLFPNMCPMILDYLKIIFQLIN